MNKKYWTYLVLLLIVTACSKTNQAHKKMAGDWVVTKYMYTNFSGLSYYYPISGDFIFDNCEEDTCNFQINCTYTVDSLDQNLTLQGRYFFLDENAEYYELLNIDSTGSIDTLHNGRVILLTKSDLKTEYSDSTGRHVFWLEK